MTAIPTREDRAATIGAILTDPDPAGMLADAIYAWLARADLTAEDDGALNTLNEAMETAQRVMEASPSR